MGVDVRQDDAFSAAVQSPVAEHLSGMRSRSPAGNLKRWTSSGGTVARITLARGDIVLVDLKGAIGAEKQGKRPCVVVQNDVANGVSSVTIVASIAEKRQDRPSAAQVAVAAADLGAWAKDSVIDCGHLRTIDRDARITKHLGRLGGAVMAKVDEALRISVGLR